MNILYLNILCKEYLHTKYSAFIYVPQKIFRYKIFGFLIDLRKIFTDELFSISVADPYHFDTDPEPESEKICYGSGSGSRK